MGDKMSSEKKSVLIVGAGPVGLMMGVQLSRLGIDFRIVEKEKEPVIMTKAAGLHARTQEILADLELIDKFYERGYPIQKGNIYAGDKKLVSMDFSNLESPYPCILDIPQYMEIPNDNSK